MNTRLAAFETITGSPAPWSLTATRPRLGAGLPVLFHSMLKWIHLQSGTGGVLGCAAHAPATAVRGNTGETENAMWNRSDATDTAARLDTTARDWDDIRASLSGDERAFERLVRRYQNSISAYMWRFTRDRHDLDELVQDVFVEAYFGLARFAGRAPLLHWLKRIATRVGYRYWRERRRRQPLPLPGDAAAVLAVADENESAREAADLVHRLLAQLAPRDRLVMTLTYLEGCNVKQLARLTGWTETMVKVQTYRARKRLAKICAQTGIEL